MITKPIRTMRCAGGLLASLGLSLALMAALPAGAAAAESEARVENPVGEQSSAAGAQVPATESSAAEAAAVDAPDPAPAEADAVEPAVEATPLAVVVLDRVWAEAKARIYPPRLATERFTDNVYESLRRHAERSESLESFAPRLNEFLLSLDVSHTQFYTDTEVNFYFFRSLFTTQDIEAPAIAHLGLQGTPSPDGWIVREVFDGLPAAQARVYRGDRLLTIDDLPFDPYLACNREGLEPEQPQQLRLARGGEEKALLVRCVRQNPNASMRDAMSASAKRFPMGELEVGYLHLWAGTHEQILERFLELVAELADTDALVLDLRGGFGGAWYDYLDPFFANRDGYFDVTVETREGSEIVPPEPRSNQAPYDRPMIVLINEGVRSGKEALAYQFQKSGRALLIGATTAGMFNAGMGLFVEPEEPYFLYLSVAESLLDGQRVESVGIAPDLEVPYSLSPALGDDDPQLRAALTILERMLSGPAAVSGG